MRLNILRGIAAKIDFYLWLIAEKPTFNGFFFIGFILRFFNLLLSNNQAILIYLRILKKKFHGTLVLTRHRSWKLLKYGCQRIYHSSLFFNLFLWLLLTLYFSFYLFLLLAILFSENDSVYYLIRWILKKTSYLKIILSAIKNQKIVLQFSK